MVSTHFLSAAGRILAVLLLIIMAATSETRAQAISPFVQSFSNPAGLAFDKSGNLYVANGLGTTTGLGNSITKVTPDGNVVTFKSGLKAPQAVAFDAAGNMYVANGADTTVSEIAPNGRMRVYAGGFKRPQALAFNARGVLYVADEIAGTVSKILPGPKVVTVATGFTFPAGLAFDAKGYLYVADAFDGVISKVTPTGAVSTFASGFAEPEGIAFDKTGNLYVAEVTGGKISKVTPSGTVSRFVAYPGPTQNTNYAPPISLLFGPNGNLYVGNLDNTVSVVTPAGVKSWFAPLLNAPSFVTFGPDGALYVADTGNNVVRRIATDGIGTTFASGLNNPQGLAFDTAGNLYVANLGANTITKVTPNGKATTFASGLSNPEGLAFDSKGNLYVAASTGGSSPVGLIQLVSAIGAVSNFAVLQNGEPYALAIDEQGNIYASASGVTHYLFAANDAVLKITTTGIVSTFASGFYAITGLTFDSKGNLFAIDSYYTNPYIYKISKTGSLAPIAQVSPTGPNGVYLNGLAFNSIGYLFLSESISSTLLQIDLSNSKIDYNIVYTKADSQYKYLFGNSQDIGYRAGLGQSCKYLVVFSMSQNYNACAETNDFPRGTYFRNDIGLDSAESLPPNDLISAGGPPDYFVAEDNGGPNFIAAYEEKTTYAGGVPPDPSAANQFAQTLANSPAAIDLTQNSWGNPPNGIMLGTATGGTVTGFPGTDVTFTPTAGFTGTGTFRFALSNREGVSNTATAFIGVGIPTPSAPVVTGISPAIGPVKGGKAVTITGKNLTQPAAVQFGSTPATIVSGTATQIVATSPAAATAGTVDITVSTVGGASATVKADKFTYH
jgi:sugar lactone lactonase YvrE